METIEAASKAELYVQQKGWNHHTSDDIIRLETCPISQCDDYCFCIRRRPAEQDGLWDCKKCTAKGNLRTLREAMGDVESVKEAAESRKPDPFPDIIRCQESLLADEEAMNYLLDQRGFSPLLVQERRLGMKEQNGKKYLVIPYIENGTLVYVKYRTLPPAEKGFFTPKGRESTLYNAEVIQPGMEELILTEGELNVVAAIGVGMRNIVGVPGANNKKMTWITRIDAAAPKKLYTLYDNDINNKHNTGQEAAEELSKRLALNTSLPTPLNIVLPEFEKLDGTRGKDLNDWFHAGHTVAELEEIKAAALPFQVRGMVSTGDALTLLEESLEGKELLEPTYVSQYDSFNRLIGGFEPGDVVDIIAKAKIGKTTFGINLIDHLVAKYEEPGLIHCLEMPVARLIRKWVSMISLTDDSPSKTPEEGKLKLQKMREAIALARDTAISRKGDLLFCDRVVRHPDEVYEMWYQAVRRYGIKFGMFDNLQLLCDITLKTAGHRTIHMSQISKHLKGIATELGLAMFRIVQPKKVFKDAMVTHEDADGSSQIEKDCDTSVSLFRSQRNKMTPDQYEQAGGFMEQDVAFDPNLFAHASITRYAPGGVCTLYMDGARSLVRELTPLEHNNIKMPQIGSGMQLLTDTETTLEA